MNIEESIKEISNYFKQKVFDGEFEFIKCDIHTAKIKVDDKYVFTIWIANEPKYSCDFYEGSLVSFGGERILKLTTQKDRLKLWKQVKPYVKDHKENILKKEKQAEINRLQKELENIK